MSRFTEASMDAIRKKLNSKSGESIAETLVALLISALALVMLAGAISATTGIIERSSKKINDYYDTNESIVKASPDSGIQATLSVETKDVHLNDHSYIIKYSKNGTFSNTPVVVFNLTGVNQSETPNSGNGESESGGEESQNGGN